MTANGIGAPAGASGGKAFFTAMALAIAAIVAAGFAPSYAQALAPPGLPFWVHLHGAAMTGWILLFAVQAWLVGRRSLALHRRLGGLSIGLVLLMAPLGLATTVLAVARHATPPFFTPAMMMAADAVDILLFVGLYAAALLLRRQAEWHKRLLLCATVLLSWPALGRITPHLGFGLTTIIPAATVLLLLLALVGPLNDLIRRRSIHPAYLWGVGLIVLAQPLHALVAASAPMQALAQRVGG